MLVDLPWWFGPALAGFVYLFLRFVLPVIGGLGSGPKPNLSSYFLAGFSIMLAPFVSLVILAVWVGAELRKLIDRKRLDNQKDLESIGRLSWLEFEKLLSEFFRRHGYLVEHRGGAGPDGGVDLVLRRDGQKALVQCKHWKSQSISVELVRELMGVVFSEGAQRGIFVTYGTYTEPARNFARDNPLMLIDGKELMAMIRSVQSNPSPETSTVDRTPPREAVAIPSTPACPLCGSPMVRRTAKRGSNAGSQFWGCPHYPGCQGTRP
jgi:restriction system protein